MRLLRWLKQTRTSETRSRVRWPSVLDYHSTSSISAGYAHLCLWQQHSEWVHGSWRIIAMAFLNGSKFNVILKFYCVTIRYQGNGAEVPSSRGRPVASYPDLLTPVFVICSTNTGKTRHMQWRIGCWVDEWRGGFGLVVNRMAFWTCETLPILTDVDHLVALWSVVVITILSCSFPGMCHSSTCQPSVQACHCTFCQAFPCVSSASDNHWGEKAWVQQG